MIAQETARSIANKQYVTGAPRSVGGFMPETAYAQALDHLVLVCVDCIPLHAGRIMLSRRTRPPQPDWWINGGRMRKGETFGAAASRLMQREIGLTLDPERFRLVGFYSLIWDERAQPPFENGCHMLSVTHGVELSSRESASISLNDEYDATQWVYPAEVEAQAMHYHPALVQIVHDLQNAMG